MNPCKKYTTINIPTISQNYRQQSDIIQHDTNNQTKFIPNLNITLSCTSTVIITILAILIANRFIYSPQSLGQKLKSIRFFGILTVNFCVGFAMFFILKFNKSVEYYCHIYILLLTIINTTLILHFYINHETYTAFDDFVKTIMFTYNSEYSLDTNDHDDSTIHISHQKSPLHDYQNAFHI